MQISYDEGNVVLTEVRDFDLAQTLECGQCFHFKNSPNRNMQSVHFIDCYVYVRKKTA